MHEPAKAADRQAAASRGGSSTSTRRRLLLGRLTFGNLGEIKEARQAVAAAVIQGGLPPARAGIVATLLKDAEASIVGFELAARLDTLESRIVGLVERRSPSGTGEAS